MFQDWIVEFQGLNSPSFFTPGLIKEVWLRRNNSLQNLSDGKDSVGYCMMRMTQKEAFLSHGCFSIVPFCFSFPSMCFYPSYVCWVSKQPYLWFPWRSGVTACVISLFFSQMCDRVLLLSSLEPLQSKTKMMMKTRITEKAVAGHSR